MGGEKGGGKHSSPACLTAGEESGWWRRGCPGHRGPERCHTEFIKKRPETSKVLEPSREGKGRRTKDMGVFVVWGTLIRIKTKI